MVPHAVASRLRRTDRMAGIPKAPALFLLVAALLFVGLHGLMTEIGVRAAESRVSADPPTWPRARDSRDESNIAQLPQTIAAYDETFTNPPVVVLFVALAFVAALAAGIFSVVSRRSEETPDLPL